MCGAVARTLRCGLRTGTLRRGAGTRTLWGRLRAGSLRCRCGAPGPCGVASGPGPWGVAARGVGTLWRGLRAGTLRCRAGTRALRGCLWTRPLRRGAQARGRGRAGPLGLRRDGVGGPRRRRSVAWRVGVPVGSAAGVRGPAVWAWLWRWAWRWSPAWVPSPFPALRVALPAVLRADWQAGSQAAGGSARRLRLRAGFPAWARGAQPHSLRPAPVRPSA